MRFAGHRGLSVAALLLGGFGLATAATSAEPATDARTEPASSVDAWAVLAEVRDQLRAASPLTATFDQSFVPGGFSTGDSESGLLYVDLPKCLRFEYRAPFPKNFLLCGDWVYTWNPGEPSGRRFLVEDSEAEGIDLLRLEVETLRGRYQAEFRENDAGIEIIRLIPTHEETEIREATVEVEGHRSTAASKRDHRLLALSYQDRSGNRTRFEIADWSRLESKAEFQAPALEWLED